LQLLELLFLTPRDPLTQLAQLGMRGFAGTCLDRLRGIGMMVLVFLEEFSFEFLTLQPSELKRNIVGTWELLAVPILQPCSHSLDTLAVLLVNSRAKVAQFFSYRFIFCARVNHPVIVVVVINQPFQEALVVGSGTRGNSNVCLMTMTADQDEDSPSLQNYE
jgi:hypothetical protein